MDNGTSVNVDECILNLHDCDKNADCIDTDGGYNCKCGNGFTGDGITCYDVDECTDGSHDCDPYNELCTNTHGSFVCNPINCGDIKSSWGYKLFCKCIFT